MTDLAEIWKTQVSFLMLTVLFLSGQFYAFCSIQTKNVTLTVIWN